MSRLNSKNIEQNIDTVGGRSGKTLINVTRVGKTPSEDDSSQSQSQSQSQLHNASNSKAIQVAEFDQGASDSLFAALNGITTELQHNLNSFGAIHYFATSTIAANDAGDVL